MHIGNREEAKMKLVLSRSEILTNSIDRGRKKKENTNHFWYHSGLPLFLLLSLLSSFKELMTWLKVNFTRFEVCGWGGIKRQKQYLLKAFTTGSWLEELESLPRPESWQGELFIPLQSEISLFYDDFCPRQKTQHVWKTHFASFVFSATISQNVKWSWKLMIL